MSMAALLNNPSRHRNPRYRESYVEKDRCVRNSTTAAVPGVDVMQNFQLSKHDFEKVFLDAADRFEEAKQDDPSSGYLPAAARRNLGGDGWAKRSRSDLGRLYRGGKEGRKKGKDRGEGKMIKMKEGRLELGNAVVKKLNGRKESLDGKIRRKWSSSSGESENEVVSKKVSLPGLDAYGGRDTPPKKGKKISELQFENSRKRGGGRNDGKNGFVRDDESFAEVEQAAMKRADGLRRLAANYQANGELGNAGSMFEQAIDTRSRFGLHCTLENGDAHVEYAQNLSKRGLIAEAEYHLRTAADIYRQQNALTFRKYADILLYLAVIIDRQGRLVESEAFYRAALGVYRGCKLGDDNVRVAIDNLSNNLRAQGREDEVEYVIKSHFSGPTTKSPRRRRPAQK